MMPTVVPWHNWSQLMRWDGATICGTQRHSIPLRIALPTYLGECLWRVCEQGGLHGPFPERSLVPFYSCLVGICVYWMLACYYVDKGPHGANLSVCNQYLDSKYRGLVDYSRFLPFVKLCIHPPTLWLPPLLCLQHCWTNIAEHRTSCHPLVSRLMHSLVPLWSRHELWKWRSYKAGPFPSGSPETENLTPATRRSQCAASTKTFLDYKGGSFLALGGPFASQQLR